MSNLTLSLKKVDKGILYMLISVVGFALMNLTVKNLKHLPATELVLFRSIVSFILTYIMIRRKRLNPFGNNKLFLILRGVFGVTALTLYFYTLQYLPLGSAITIQYLSPIFTVFFAIFILKETMRPIQWVYFAISFAGIAVIKGFEPNITIPLLLAGIGSAVFSGVAYNCIRKVKNTDHPLIVVFYFPLIAIPAMTILSINNFIVPVGKDWILLIVMGVFTQIAQIYMTKAYQTSTLNKVAPLKYIGILFAISFDFFIFGISYQPLVFAGIALVVVGVILNLILKSPAQEL